MFGLVVKMRGASVHGGKIAGQETAFTGRTLFGNDIAINTTEEIIFAFAE